MMEWNGFEVCKILRALRLHFTTDKYDFHKYNGHFKLSEESFRTSKDRFYCNKLARLHTSRPDFIDYASTVYAHSDDPNKLWTQEFLNPKSKKCYLASTDYIVKFDFNFKNQIDFAFHYAHYNYMPISNLIVPVNGQEPPIFMLHKQQPDKFSLETLTVMNRIMNITGSCDQLVTDDLFYPITRNKIKKYELFLISRIDNYYARSMAILKEKVKEYLTPRPNKV